jgi:MFS family permease
MTMFLIYAFLWAMAVAMESGTDNAFIYDTLKEEGREREFKRLNGLYRVMWTAGATVGSVIGGYMATVSLEFPIVMTLIPVGLSFFLILGLKEPAYEKEEHRNVLRQMTESSKVLFGSRNLVILVVIGFLLVGFGETIHMMKAIFYEFNEVPILYFGYLAAAGFALASLGFYFSHWLSERVNERRFLTVAVATGGGFVLAATLVSEWWWVAVLMVIPAFFFGLRGPVIDDIVNREVASSKRATVNSLISFARQLGMTLVAPFLGYFADLYSIEMAYQLSGCVMVVGALLFLFLKEKKSC